MLVGSNWVQVPAALGSFEEKLDGRSENATLGSAASVVFAAEEEDWECGAEADGGDEVREVETDVTLRIRHSELPSQGTDVDEKVEPVVDSGRGDSRVDNDAFSTLQGPDLHPLAGDLLSHERRDVGLETSGTDAHDDQTNNESGQRVMRMSNERRGGRSSEDDMANDSNDD